MSTRGKLLVSTETSATGRKTATIISFLFEVAAGIFCIHYSESETFGFVLGCLIIGGALFSVIMRFINLKSYCEVYENAVVGTTTMGWSTGGQSFEISYDEIMNITQSGKVIQIYTKYTCYNVLALACMDSAIAEIRSRMSSSNT